MKVSNDVRSTIKKINQIIKSMEKENFQKSGSSPMGEALYNAFNTGNHPVITRLMQQIQGGLSSATYADLSRPDGSWLRSVRQNLSSILQSSGIASGSQVHYNQKHIIDRPRIMVVGPDGGGLDHADSYFYTHSMLSRAMKLLGISHADEPIWITPSKPEFASSYIMANNKMRNITDSYDRAGSVKASLSTPGLVGMFARTFGHDTFTLPAVPSADGDTGRQSQIKTLLTSLGASLATHVIVLGKPNSPSGSYVDTRSIAIRAAKEFGIPLLQTSDAFDSAETPKADALRSELMPASKQGILPLIVQHKMEPMNQSRRERFKKLEYSIKIPNESTLKTFGGMPMQDVHGMRKERDPEPGQAEYKWGYSDVVPTQPAVAKQRARALTDDIMWPRLMSPSVYSQFAGSFHYGIPSDGSPLWGPDEFPHDSFFTDSSPRQWRRVLPLLTMTPHSNVDIANSAEVSIPHLGMGGLIDTYLPQEHGDILFNSSSDGHQHIVDVNMSYDNQPPAFATRMPSSFSSQFVRPRDALPSGTEAAQYFGAFCTNLKRYYDEHPVETTNALRGTVKVPETVLETDIPAYTTSKINENRSKIMKISTDPVIEAHNEIHGTIL